MDSLWIAVLAGVLAIATAAIWLRTRVRLIVVKADFARAAKDLALCTEAKRLLEEDQRATHARLESVRPWLAIVDTEAEAKRLLVQAEREAARIRAEAAVAEESAQRQAQRTLEAAQAEAHVIKREMRDKTRERLEVAERQVTAASDHAHRLIEEAKARAEEIAGDAYQALQNVEQLQRTAEAMQNKIEGYRDRYLVPTYSFLDELADAYGFAEAGQQLKLARERSQLLVEQGRGETCDYVEANRRETAIRFVLDAFNGKVDSILSRSKSDNVGTLRQQIIDAFALVNFNGAAFRKARIVDDYLAARLAGC